MTTMLSSHRTCSSSHTADVVSESRSLSTSTDTVVFDLNRLTPHLKEEFDVKRNSLLWKLAQNADSESVAVDPLSRRVAQWKCRACACEWPARISDRCNRVTASVSGCPACRSTQQSTEGVNTSGLLVHSAPEAAKAWDELRNFAAENHVPFDSVDVVTTNSDVSCWWKCGDCQASWKEPVYSLVNAVKYGRARTASSTVVCPRCEEAALSEVQRSQRAYLSDHRLLMLEVHSLRNGQVPTKMELGGAYHVSWQCCACEYKYSTPLRDRALFGQRCPRCTGAVPAAFNLLEVQRPDVFREMAAGVSSRKLSTLTTTSDALVRFVCHTCIEPFKMTVRQRCSYAPSVVACPKCRRAAVHAVSSHHHRHQAGESRELSVTLASRRKAKNKETMTTALWKLHGTFSGTVN